MTGKQGLRSLFAAEICTRPQKTGSKAGGAKARKQSGMAEKGRCGALSGKREIQRPRKRVMLNHDFFSHVECVEGLIGGAPGTVGRGSR